MKLRSAKKILKNWQCGEDYPESTLTRASKKYRPYLMKSCKKFNDEHKGEGVLAAPFIIRNIITF